MFAAQTRLRSILSGRFTFKFGSFNWIRFMITSLCPFTYCTYNPEKVSRYYEKNKKREHSCVECSLYRIYPHKSDTRGHYPILYGLLLGVHNKTEKNILSGFYT